MENNKRLELIKKRQDLQVKVQAESYIEQYVEPIVEILDFLQTQEAPYQIIGLLHIPIEYHPYVEQTIINEEFASYGLRTQHLHNTTTIKELIDKAFDQYPSTNELRYVPDLTEYANYNTMDPESGDFKGIELAMQGLDLKDEQVYVYFLTYGLVLQMSLNELSIHEHDDIFNPWVGDAMIIPDHLDWMIAFTLEEEWLAGRK